MPISFQGVEILFFHFIYLSSPLFIFNLVSLHFFFLFHLKIINQDVENQELPKPRMVWQIVSLSKNAFSSRLGNEFLFSWHLLQALGTERKTWNTKKWKKKNSRLYTLLPGLDVTRLFISLQERTDHWYFIYLWSSRFQTFIMVLLRRILWCIGFLFFFLCRLWHHTNHPFPFNRCEIKGVKENIFIKDLSVHHHFLFHLYQSYPLGRNERKHSYVRNHLSKGLWNKKGRDLSYRWNRPFVTSSLSSLSRSWTVHHQEMERDAVLSFGKKGKVLRVLPSGRWLPRNQGWLNFWESKLVTVRKSLHRSCWTELTCQGILLP